jgi:hypothetical protein
MNELYEMHREWWRETHRDDPVLLPSLMLLRPVSSIAKLLAHSRERDTKGVDLNGQVAERLGDIVLYCFSILHVRDQAFRWKPTQYKFVEAEQGLEHLLGAVHRNLSMVVGDRGHNAAEVMHSAQMYANCCAVDLQAAVYKCLEKCRG